MNSIAFFCLAAVVPLVSCEETPKTKSTGIDKSIPGGKKRAAAAAANVRPKLEPVLVSKGLSFGDPVYIRAFKEERELELLVLNKTTGKFDLFETYRIAGMSGVPGPKLAEGDSQVPEGFYFVPPAAMNPASRFHLSFNIGYPNEYDRARGRTGSAIMIHGNEISIGCLAMTDERIEEIYSLCDAAHQGGQAFFRVHIFPFRMTAERMSTLSGEKHEEFWKNLAEGYELFEQTHVPPNASANAGRYVFAAH